jgi:LDH2 family malate/lactate/ureidoglycolate dehydrogenase
MIGMVTTSGSGIQVRRPSAPRARLGTDPIAFAAPGRPGEPFLLDMATTTVAGRQDPQQGDENLPAPAGLAGHPGRLPSTDPRRSARAAS